MTYPLLLCGLLGPLALSAPQDTQEDDGVRLVVLVVVDQMIPEQLERLEPWLQGGLGRFARGEVWRNGAHGHAKTETGPGHAAIGTGRFPNHSGIVANSWVDYASGAEVYCAGDPDARLVSSRGLGPAGSAGSSKNLLVDGISDFIRAQDAGAKSISIAGKDRAAIMTAGRQPNLALWWERGSGTGFCSSDLYTKELPGWVHSWNADWVERASGWSWEAGLEGLEGSGMAADLRPGEPRAGFPHDAPELGEEPSSRARAGLANWVYVSPLMDQYVIELAMQAVDSESLGADQATDFLFVGLSACDTLGHTFGPYSQEVTDLMLRVDEQLGALFSMLDERVGAQRWIAGLSADHGVLPLPEALPDMQVPALRVSGRALQRARAQVSAEVEEVFGAPYLKAWSHLAGRLDTDALEADGIDAEEVSRLVIEGMQERLPWLHGGYTRKQMSDALRVAPKDDMLLTLSARSFHPERSLDFQLIQRPWVLISGGSTGTSHGSPWPYDTRVPIAFIGPGSKPRSQRFEACLTVDILPTLLERAGLPVPEGLDGQVLR